jgi:hypothetical protein
VTSRIAPATPSEEGGGKGQVNFKGSGMRIVLTKRGEGALRCNISQMGGCQCSRMVKWGWRRIRKLWGGKELAWKEMVNGGARWLYAEVEREDKGGGGSDA